MFYTEVAIELTPHSEEGADIVVAAVGDLPFHSFYYQEPILKCYIESALFSQELLMEVVESLSKTTSTLYKVEVAEIEPTNWNEVWERNYSPIVIGKRCTVKASFHNNTPVSQYNITIDPKMAFGTGHHSTTALMVETILDCNIRGRRVLDMGCGTGILSILAAMMGATKRVLAVDIDSDAVESTIENCLNNGVADSVEVVCGDIGSVEGRSFDTIFANISKNIVLDYLEEFAKMVNSGGEILLSGFYQEEIDQIVAKGREVEFDPSFIDGNDRWAVVKMVKR
ncbi:MAG: 50S ribosomal protein L11 methyltransferase [Bacteroidales bacterium]